MSRKTMRKTRKEPARPIPVRGRNKPRSPGPRTGGPVVPASHDRRPDGRSLGGAMRLMIVPDDEVPGRRCTPAEVINELGSGGRLPTFMQELTAPSPDGLGNCHHIALGLMTDLILADKADGWVWVEGQIRTNRSGWIAHSWLEYDGWAIDAVEGGILFVRAASHLRMTNARNMTKRDSRQTCEWTKRMVG
jgi:hypothetical protein